MANRKSGKELRKEYQGLLDKTKAMQKRLKKRAEDLIKQYPDVVYHEDVFGGVKTGGVVTVSRYQQYYKITPMVALTIIEKIEQHIADQHPHQQTEMFKNSPVFVPESPVGERVIINGKTGEAMTRCSCKDSYAGWCSKHHEDTL